MHAGPAVPDGLRQRFVDEHIAVQIYVEARPQAYEQMLFDVADNALGINQAVKARFDSRKVLVRSALTARTSLCGKLLP